jgi:hypothetical protein
MEAKYGEAVIAGIFGGILAAILFVAVILIGIYVTDVTWFTLGEFSVWVLLAAVMLFTGVLTVSKGRAHFTDLDDAAIASAVAGAIAGFIGAAVFAIGVAVTQIFLQYDFLADLGRFEVLATRSLLSLICGGLSCCLLPVIMLGAIILAVIGGWICWLAVKK